MYAVRRDLGHTNTNFHTGDLLGLFVNDIQQLMQATEASVATEQ
jgi:hypothetical protein